MSILLKNAIQIAEWCRLKFKDKQEWERRLPSTIAKNQEEKKLGYALHTIKQNVMKKYEGVDLHNIGDEDDREIVQIIRKVESLYGSSIYLKNALEIENWCNLNNDGKELWARKIPTSTSKDENERKLCDALKNIKIKVVKKYRGQELQEIEDETDRKIVEIVRSLDNDYAYGPGQVNHNYGKMLEIENWCMRNFKNEPIWKKRLPASSAKDEYESKLGSVLSAIKQRYVKKYRGKELNEIDNENERNIVSIARRLKEQYGLSRSLKNAIELKQWCVSKFEGKEIGERRLPSRTAEDEYERQLWSNLATLRCDIMRRYENSRIEEIVDDEERRVVEIVRDLYSEYNGLTEKQQLLAEAKKERDAAYEKNKKVAQLEDKVNNELEHAER